MIDKRVTRKIDLADNADAARLGLHPLKLDALLGLVLLDPRKSREKIEMPP